MVGGSGKSTRHSLPCMYFFCYLLLSSITTLHTPQHHTPQPPLLLLLLHLHHTHFRPTHPHTHTHTHTRTTSTFFTHTTQTPTTLKQQDTITKVNTRTASSLSPQKHTNTRTRKRWNLLRKKTKSGRRGGVGGGGRYVAVKLHWCAAYCSYYYNLWR